MFSFKKKYLLVVFILLGIFLFIPHYKINSSFYKVSVKKLTLFEQAQNTYKQITNRILNKSSSGAYGIRAPGDCATQPIELDLTGGELAEILNKAKPVSILLYNIRLDVRDQKIIGSVTSAYPFLPGSLSGIGTLQGTTFTIFEAYIGPVPIPQSIISRIGQKANSYFNDLLIDYGFKLTNSQIRNNRIHISALICPGLLQRDAAGNWIVDTTVVHPQGDNVNQRY